MYTKFCAFGFGDKFFLSKTVKCFCIGEGGRRVECLDFFKKEELGKGAHSITYHCH